MIDRDTVLPATFATPGDLIVRQAEVRLEGVVEGAVVVLGGALFVRPGARIGGPIAVVLGGFYPSALAEVGPSVEMPLDLDVHLREAADTLWVEVRGPPVRPQVILAGLFGVRRISYDRVDGLGIGWGPQVWITGREAGPRLDGWARFHTARRGWGGGAVLAVPLGRELELIGRIERGTFTNEAWIRGDLVNSVEALLLGRDVRDHYESDVVSVTLARVWELPAEGALSIAPYATFRSSLDRSLAAREPWSLFGRAALGRANLPVEEARIGSVEAGTILGWEGSATRLIGAALLERAIPEAGDLRFTRWSAAGSWSMQALWDHSLYVTAHARGSLGSSAAPPQRWSFVGGLGTLPTLPVAAARGDRVIFIESTYRVPLPLQLPMAGSPALHLTHATGTAWQTGSSMPGWEQNLGAGIEVLMLRLSAWIDPSLRRPRPTILLYTARRLSAF